MFAAYTDRVCAEAADRAEEIRNTLDTNTLYIGGGTPSVLPPFSLARMAESVLRALRSSRSLSGFEEFTVEVNPEDIVEKGQDYVKALLDMGVNRFSMGVQSFDDGMLRFMNRRHDAASAVKAFEILRHSGVENISIDLIFGINGLSDSMLEDSLSKALALSPEHISAYQLSVEEGSALWKMTASGRYKELDEQLCRRQYDRLCSRLAGAYEHYEISNFAKPGYRARHNSAYWHRVPYVGLGAGAHSFDGLRRSWNSEKVLDYTPGFEVLTDNDAIEETLLLGLRTSDGLPLNWLSGHCDQTILNRLLDSGALVRHGGLVRIPENRFFVSDEIIRELA